MNDCLVRGGEGAEILTRERVYIRERLNDPAIPRVSLADARLEPGVTTELHRLTVDEWYVIELGAGMMEVAGGKPFAVGAGDSVVIRAGESQRITNTGNGDLRFLCVCMPRFTAECYETL